MVATQNIDPIWTFSLRGVLKAVLKAKGGPTQYLQGVPNQVASECVCVCVCIYMYVTCMVTFWCCASCFIVLETDDNDEYIYIYDYNILVGNPNISKL